MRKLFLILIAIALVACGDDKKKPTDADTSKVTDVKEKALSKVEEIAKKYNFEKVDNLLENPSLVNLTSESHAFSEDIVFEEVNILKTGEDTYSLILVFNEKTTNFDVYNNWQIAIIATAKDPSKFKDPAIRSKGSKTNGIKAKTVLMGNEIVASGTFSLAPKEFTFIRFYLYDASNNKNTNYYTLKDVTIP
ncbi:hypothetical protein [Kordia jejudonensis]|uniref:hypothetical protein n=1 Tax=Kordia jejudonensis TaxID=1348245 RepID=UPI00062982DF|nr:hypothetical protein [Kordia jejudonensis]